MSTRRLMRSVSPFIVVEMLSLDEYYEGQTDDEMNDRAIKFINDGIKSDQYQCSSRLFYLYYYGKLVYTYCGYNEYTGKIYINADDPLSLRPITNFSGAPANIRDVEKFEYIRKELYATSGTISIQKYIKQFPIRYGDIDAELIVA